jgi:hypothetical protein
VHSETQRLDTCTIPVRLLCCLAVSFLLGLKMRLVVRIIGALFFVIAPFVWAQKTVSQVSPHQAISASASGFNSARQLMVQAKHSQARVPRSLRHPHSRLADVTALKNHVAKVDGKVDHFLQVEEHRFVADSAKQPFFTEPVMLTPTAKVVADYSGHDLLINFPGALGLDYALLQQRQAYEAFWRRTKLKKQQRPLLTMSGGLAASVSFGNAQRSLSSTQRFIPQSDVDLSQADLAFFMPINNFFLGYMVLSYESSVQQVIASDRVGNSRIYLNKGFMTIGNLDKAPTFVSLGQMDAPFGSFSSGAVSSPLTASLGQITGRLIKWTVTQGSLMSHVFVMRGSTGKAGHLEQINQAGFQITHTIDLAAEHKHLKWGVGVVNNLTDAKAILATLAEKKGADPLTITHPVRGLDAFIMWQDQAWQVSFEVVRAMQAFDTADFSGVQPSAFHLEGQVHLLQKHAKQGRLTVGMSFGQSSQASVFDVPRRSYTVFVSGHLWPDTLQKFEYRHNTAYATQTKPSMAKDQILLKFFLFF